MPGFQFRTSYCLRPTKKHSLHVKYVSECGRSIRRMRENTSGQVSGTGFTQSTEKDEREGEYVAPFQTRTQSPLSYFSAREGNAQ